VLLSYTEGTIVKSKKVRSQTAIAKSRASVPEIYVKLKNGDFYRVAYAKASIRVKAREYQYLTWRDRDQVRTFYLGRKRKG
jgi:hypothetical protein